VVRGSWFAVRGSRFADEIDPASFPPALNDLVGKFGPVWCAEVWQWQLFNRLPEKRSS